MRIFGLFLLFTSLLAQAGTQFGTANQVMRVPSGATGATRPTLGPINLASSAAVTGVLPAANGGVGTLGTGAMSANGSTITYGTLSVPNGGTGQTSFTSGNLITGNGTSGLNAISQLTSKSFLPSVGQQVSSSSSAFTTSSTSPVDVTNLSVTITTTGRPVILIVQPVGTGTTSDIGISSGGTGANFFLVRASTTLAWWARLIPSATGTDAGFSSLVYIDAPSAGTYTYKIQASGNSSTVARVTNCVLAAYEL